MFTELWTVANCAIAFIGTIVCLIKSSSEDNDVTLTVGGTITNIYAENRYGQNVICLEMFDNLSYILDRIYISMEDYKKYHFEVDDYIHYNVMMNKNHKKICWLNYEALDAFTKS